MKKSAVISSWCLGCVLLIGFTAADAPAQCVPAPGGLIGFWAGDGSATDLFGTNHGTLSGNANANAIGRVDQCFSFNGTNSFVSVPDSPQLRPTNLTIEAWVKFDSLTSQVSGGASAGYQYLVFKKNTRGNTFEGFSLQKSPANAFEFIVSSAAGDFRRVTSTALISTGQWFHVAGVRGPNSIQLYVNGALVDQTNVTAPQDYDSTPLYFGSSGISFYDAKLKGSLDEVTLYNRALTAAEIAIIYAANANGKCKQTLNDNFQNSRVIVGLTNTVTANNTTATKETGEFDHAGDTGGHSLWWSWKAPTNGVVTIDTDGSSFDTLLAVYTGSQLTNLTEVASNDQMGNDSDQSRISFTVTNNSVYRIAVDGWNGDGGTIILNLRASLTPVITESPVSATNIVANTQTFQAAALSATPMTYQWRKGGAIIPNATNSTLNLVNLRAEDSGAYSIAVSNSYGVTISQSAELTVPVAPANDQFTNRTFFGGYSNSIAGSNIGASMGDAPNSYYWGSGDVWFAWISPTNGTVTISTAGSSTLVSCGIYWNAGTNLNSVAGDGFGEMSDSFKFTAVAGREYVFEVGGFVSGAGSILLNLRMQLLPPSFLSQPQSSYAVVGGSAFFTVDVAGSLPLFYQWFRGGVPLSNQTNESIFFNSTQPTNAGTYSVSVSNAFGSILSSNASLIVLPPGTNNLFANRIMVAGNTNTLIGHNVDFSKESNEPDHAGQPGGASAWWSWVASSNGVAIVNLAGSSFDTLLGVYTGNSISNLTQIAANDDNGTNTSSRVLFPCVANTSYHIAVDGKGYAEGTIALSIQRPASLSPQIVRQPKPFGGLVGTNAQFSVVAYGIPTNLTYRWFSNSVAITGATNSSLLLSNVQLGWSGAGFSVAVSNSVGAVTSTVATLTVVAPAAVTFKGNWPGYWGGNANDVQISGSYAYVATDAGLLVLDVSDPQNPYRVGDHSTDTPAIRITHTNGFAYLVTASNQIAGARVSRFDVRNAALPKKVAEYPAFAPQAIIASSNHVYLGDGTNLLILNSSLQLVRSYPMNGDLVELHLLEQELVVTMNAIPGIEIFQISNPTNLLFLSSLSASWRRTTAFGQNLYLIGYESEFPNYVAQAVDISNPAFPKYAGAGPVAGAYGIDAVSGFTANNGLLHLFWWNHNWPETRVAVFDISNERYVIPVGDYVMPPGGSGSLDQRFGLSGAGNYLFVAAGASGLMILDTSNPAKPSLAGQFYTAVQAEDVAIENNYAFITDRTTGFHILDVSNPVNPTRVGTYHVTNHETNSADKIFIQGRYAYVGVSALNWVQGFEIVDISDPANPRFLAKLPLPGGDAYYSELQVTALSVKDDLAIMATLGGIGRNFYLLDVHDKTKPMLLQRFFEATFGGDSISSLLFHDGHVFAGQTGYDYSVQRDQASLNVYEINAATNLALIAQRTIPSPTNSYDSEVAVSIDGNNCYLGWMGITEIFDISQPGNPQRMLTEPFRGEISLSQNFKGFGSDSETGIHIYDLTNPLMPVLNASFDGIYGTTKVEGRYAFVAGTEAGLTILDLGSASATAPLVKSQPESIRTIPGATTNLFVGASGTVPLGYQWRFNGTNLPGSTSALLVLADVRPEDAGAYSVFISNSKGSNLSASATLTVDYPPEVTLLTPGLNQHFLPGSNIVVTASVFDPDSTNQWNGYVKQIAFYTNAALWITITNPSPDNTLFSAVLTNLPLGSHTIEAVATDNEGATNASTTVPFAITDQSVFQLSRSNYVVSETNGVVGGTNGSVTVTVTRSSGGSVGSVTLFTANATAKAAAPSGGIGSYYATNQLLTFPQGVLSTEVAVTLVNDLVNRGERQFVVALTNATNGTLIAPSNAYVTIIDDDPLTNNFADVVLPGAVTNGHLQIWLEPASVQGQWRFWWESEWHTNGSIVSNLSVGSYGIEFSPQSGYVPPANVELVVSNAVLTVSTNYYTPVTVTATGGLGVELYPPEAVGAQWRLMGQSNWNNSATVVENLKAGDYQVEFQPVSGFYTPPLAILHVEEHQNLMYEVTYVPVTPPLFGGPVALPSYFAITNDATDQGTPYRFSGQIVSELGYASGFVVKERTVLTAAHATFDPVRLSYVTNVWWLFQRQRGEHEPRAQEARGFLIFQGYASSVSEDQTNRHLQFNESSTETRNLDVAALYFTGNDKPGLGGYGGYLLSSTNQSWLANASLKMIVGYPIDGIAPTNQGKMHLVGPFFDSFELATNQVYHTDAVFSYPGNSGGPVCVLSANSAGRPFFIPAAVYLGGSGETVARAIDLDIVDLINRAENSSHAGTNSTGGGVILVQTTTGGSLSRYGILKVSVGPPAAVRLGGAWRVSPTNYGSFRAYTNYTTNTVKLPVKIPNFTIEMKPLDGFDLLFSNAITVVPDKTVQLPLSYRVKEPRLLYDRSQGLAITGTTGTSYQVEWTASPGAASNWQPLSTVTNLNGTNWIPNTLPSSSNRFFRAKWLTQ